MLNELEAIRERRMIHKIRNQEFARYEKVNSRRKISGGLLDKQSNR